MAGAFKFNPKQSEAIALIGGDARHVMLEGGGRSGKTFVACWTLAMRAIAAPGSRHVIFRFRFNHVKSSIWYDTFPKMMALCFPGVKYTENKTDWFLELAGGSQIWIAGLDDKERTEKILGLEFATIYLNECSQIPYPSTQTAGTRLAQRVNYTLEGQTKTLRLKMLYDQNPPSKGHWTYKVFHKKLDPENGHVLLNPDNYAHILLNPMDNRDNIAPEYIEEMESASSRIQRRFLHGEYGEETPNALFPDTVIDRWRVLDGKIPDLIRIVVAVDPSGADEDGNSENDAIGIVVAGLGTDGKAYVLEDCTVKAGPATWGRVATTAYDRHSADVIVGEKNYGGAMVRFTIQTARPNTNYKEVNASRGKAVRAEPISALYESGKVCHVGFFRALEDELCGFSTTGYTGSGSPNRADALVWAITELFPGIVADKAKPEQRNRLVTASVGRGFWSR